MVKTENQGLLRVPLTTATLNVEEAKKVHQLVERFEKVDDLQNTYNNLEFTSELEAAHSEER